VANDGEAAFQIDSLHLIFPFSKELSNYTVNPILSFPDILNAIEDTTYNFTMDVTGAAQLGLDTLSAQLFGQEVSSGTLDSTTAESFDFWTVQERPIVSIDSIFLSDTLLSTGQQDVTGTIVLSNAAGTDRADARIDSIAITFVQGSDTNFTIASQTPPIIPFDLSEGQQVAFNFDLDVNSNAVATDYIINSYTEYSDVNDGTPATLNPPLPQETFTVQTVSSLDILSFTIAPDTASQGQDSVLATITYQNTGTATVEVR